MSTPSVKYLKDYRRPEFTLTATRLCFELFEHQAIVTSELDIQAHNPSLQTALVLDGESLTLLGIKLNGNALEAHEYSLTETSLSIPNVPASFTLQIRTEIQPQNNTKLEGLYKTGKMFCTQCEANGFRRITYYLDRPDVMSSFSCKIIADKNRYPILLSNGNKIDSGELDQNRHFAIWHDPFPKPCYLFALVAGDLAVLKDQYRTQSGRTVNLEIYTTLQDIDKCHYAMESLKQAMRWDEAVYKREYDLDVYMIVVAHDFNMGAMENKGLNVFNSKYVLANAQTSTDMDFQNIHAVIGHEYFHNWTGNRITCRDWFQLSLKEGLTVFRDQEFTSDHFSRAVKRIEDVKALRSQQFAEDASPMAHPVRPESYIEMNNFYTATVYNKGAEVIRMQHTLLGEQQFHAAMAIYFKRYDGQAVTCDDFVNCMEEASGRDLNQFRRWYNQAGTPLIKARDEYDAESKVYRLILSQSCPPTPGHAIKLPFHIPVKIGLVGPDGNDLLVNYQGSLASTHLLELTEPQQSFEFTEVAQAPVPSLLRDFSAPVRVAYPHTEAQLLHLLAHDSNAFNRWDASQILATRYLEDLTAAIKASQTLSLPTAYIEAMRRTLLSHSDPALIAEALTLPSEKTIAELIPEVDPIALHQAREYMLSTLAQALKDAWLFVYHQHHSHAQNDEISATVTAKRRLKNLCLHYLLQHDLRYIELANTQFHHSDNMTDQLAALSALLNAQHGSEHARKALATFYQRWQHEALVVDKWLLLQASAKHAEVLSQVETLTTHPAFDIKNPNKVYALLMGFTQNMAQFHRADGLGYRFIADKVMQLDIINPQVAARLVRSLMNWRKFNPSRQDLMRKELERLSQSKLSSDVFEIVNKSLT